MDYGIVRYKSGYKHQLVEAFHYQTILRPGHDLVLQFSKLDMEGLLMFDPGYAWDGPSGEITIPPFLPKWLPAIRMDITKDDKKSMRGSLVHDGLYEFMRKGFLALGYRKYADQLLKEICIEDGMSPFLATQWRNAVANFARGSALPSSIRPVRTAP